MVLRHLDDGKSFPREMLATLYGDFSFQPAQHRTRTGTGKPVVTRPWLGQSPPLCMGSNTTGECTSWYGKRGMNHREGCAMAEGLRARKRHCSRNSFLKAHRTTWSYQPGTWSLTHLSPSIWLIAFPISHPSVSSDLASCACLHVQAQYWNAWMANERLVPKSLFQGIKFFILLKLPNSS